MGTLKTFLPVALAFTLPACVVVPTVDKYQDSSAACRTYTRSMSLKSLDLPLNGACHDEECLAALLIISAGSVLISGSIVLTGNAVHWLEYQGTCSDSFLNAARHRFLDSINTASIPKI